MSSKRWSHRDSSVANACPAAVRRQRGPRLCYWAGGSALQRAALFPAVVHALQKIIEEALLHCERIFRIEKRQTVTGLNPQPFVVAGGEEIARGTSIRPVRNLEQGNLGPARVDRTPR